MTRIGFGGVLDKIGQKPLLTRDEEVALSKRIQAGDRAAKDELVERNLRLVVSIARKFVKPDVPIDDLVSTGTIGLMRAADKYDWQKGCKFSTYAYWWIRDAIMCQSRGDTTPHDCVHIDKALDDGTTLGEMLSDDGPTVDDTATSNAYSADVTRALDTLSDDEHQVIERRYAMSGYATDSPTLRSISRELGLSPERVLQLQLSGLGRLSGLLSG